MSKSHGERRKTRYKLQKNVRERGLSPVSRAIQEFEIGQSVHIKLDPSVHRGMSNPKFHGKTGKVIGQRGRAYILEVSDGNATKQVILYPEHLRPQI
ncbi:MAG TPA: 50S ribosomal protein L21e [Candidatus Nanoarchaeia archaeon]|nr:50S ribosomal protein L21e [Candidatus Nanoarchaeia archaeon]